MRRLKRTSERPTARTLQSCLAAAISARGGGAALVLLLWATVGCSTPQYSASTLPSHLRAGPVGTPRVSEWARLRQARFENDTFYPGDTVEVSVLSGLEEQQNRPHLVRVDSSGVVDIPLVGTVSVQGHTPATAADAIRRASIERGLFVDPKVTVRVAERRVHRITVTGAVEKADVYEIPAASADLVAALAAAGGLKEEAEGTVEIRRPARPVDVQQVSFGETAPATEQALMIDLRDLDAAGQQDLSLPDGSVVTVHERPDRFVRVIGLVRNPGAYEMPLDGDMYLLDAIAEAGYTTINVADRVSVLRRTDPDAPPVTIGASLKEAMKGGPENIRLAPGDVVKVNDTPTTVVVGAVRDFFRVGFSAALPGL